MQSDLLFHSSQSILIVSFHSIRFDSQQILTPTSVRYSLFSLEVGDVIVLWNGKVFAESLPMCLDLQLKPLPDVS